MRILHTSDWHAGKTLYKQDRLPDLEHALQQMLVITEQDQVDLVMVAGDLFDTFHPPARAGEVLNRFFMELHRRQLPALIISGNHDSTQLWRSLRELLSLASIHVFDQVNKQAYWRFRKGDERLCVTALPYPSERQLVRLGETAESLADQRRHYAERVGHLLALLAAPLEQREDPDEMQLLCAHLMLNGAEPSHSERALSIADTFAVQPQQLPAIFDYIALGHIHKRQKVKGSPVPAWYCGTPYQIDFGEQGASKGVQLVDLVPGQSPQVSFRELELLHPLQLISCHEDELPGLYGLWSERPDYLKLRVRVDARRKGLSDELRSRFGPQLLGFEIQLPDAPERTPRYQQLQLDAPLEVYRTYCAAQGLPLDDELEATFLALLEATQR
ncbi:MAG: metallophosphoesterase family protein [Candidatus Sericytochromatia bacterium]